MGALGLCIASSSTWRENDSTAKHAGGNSKHLFVQHMCRYLASGSFDRTLDIWNVQDGALIKTYEGQGGIFEVCWERSGNYVAACFSNKTVAVIDLDL